MKPRYECEVCGNYMRNKRIKNDKIVCWSCFKSNPAKIEYIGLKLSNNPYVEAVLNKTRIVRQRGSYSGSGVIYVPNWLIGKKVKINLLEEEDE